MNLRRVGILLGNELAHGSQSFMVIFAVIVPLAISLVVSLLFGTMFLEKPKLGIADQGDSRMGQLARRVESLVVTEHSSSDDLRQAVAAGAADIGVVLPAGFDERLAQGETVQLVAYIWGQSLLKNRAIAGTSVAVLLREIAGQSPPVEVVTTTVGEGQAIPWDDRLLPFIVLMTITLGGVMVPATSLVNEKQKRTLTALTVTPTSLGEVFVAKGLMGVLLSLLMGLVILVVNGALGGQPVLLVVVLALGACMAAQLGVLLGAFVKDINTLFATIKGAGLVLYAPALIFMFPEIPQWIAKVFPTYYMIGPVIEFTQRGSAWPDVATDVVILIGLIVILFLVLAAVAKRATLREA